ncbi:MAG: fused MFS/spermidine synthase [Halieaceae bacterium]|nr:fused MFS/spermidine synthase [Halieaceae bacterium]
MTSKTRTSGFHRALAGCLALFTCLAFATVAQPDRTGIAPAQTLVHEAPSDFNRSVLVVDRGAFRSMRFGSLRGEDQSRIRPGYPKQLPMPYLQSAAVGLAVPEKLSSALVIGLGGGAFPSFLQAVFPDLQIDAVEIDPVVAQLARNYFTLQEGPRLRVHVIDAVEFVQRKSTAYDYILLDAYDADDLPAALTTGEFLDDVKEQLAGNGVLVVNIAISNDYRSRWLTEQFTARYAHCLHLRSSPSLNDVLLLSDAAIPRLSELRDTAARLDTDDATRRGMRRHISAAASCS